MIFRWGFALAVISGLAATFHPAAATVIDGIAATVNGEVITLLDLEKAGKARVEKELRTTLKRERVRAKRDVLRSVLDQLILRTLQIQRARELRLTVSETELSAAIENIMKNNSLTEEMLARALAEQGLTMETYRDQISEQILFSKLMQQEIRARITVTTEEVESYYLDHEKDYYRPERIRVRHLLIKANEESSAEELQTSRKKVGDILAEFKGGEDFIDLIRSYSPETIQGDESLSGWLTRGEFLKELEDVAFSLPVGEVSDPIRSQAGFHLIQVAEREEASQLAVGTVSESIREKLLREKMKIDHEAWLREMREKAQVEILY
jgi:parvulin-like peptidyl-prolyl isomerase